MVAEEASPLRMEVEGADADTLGASDGEIYPAIADRLEVGDGEQLVGRFVDGPLLLLILRRAGAYEVVEARGRHHGDVGEERRGEVETDGGAVLERDPAVDDDGGGKGRDGGDGHSGTDEKEGNVAGGVELAYFGKYGEGRVVDDDAILWVFCPLVVATRIEGAEDGVVVGELALLAQILEHGLIDVGRRVGVVGGLGEVAKLGDVGFVIVEDDGVAASALLHLRLIGRTLGSIFGEEVELFHFFVFLFLKKCGRDSHEGRPRW